MQGSLRWVIDTGFNFKPWSDNVKDVGSSTLRLKHLYTGTYVDTTAGAVATEILNAATTGTTLNKLAKVTGSPATAVIASTSDTGGMIGIVVDGAGTSGSAQIAREGQASCAFDAATTAGDYVQISSATAGDCHDAGAGYPGMGQVLGRVLTTNGSAGVYAMLVAGAEIQAPTAGNVNTVFARSGTITAQAGDYAVSQVTGAASLASPAFTGAPTAPTPATTDNSTKIATTAWVGAQGYASPTSMTQGYPLTGSGTSYGSSPLFLDATAFCPSHSYSAGKCTTGDMFQAIAAAIASGTTSTTIDARGFYGSQAVSAANLTTSLMGLTTGGEVHLGNVHIYINGPSSSLTATSNFSFADTVGAGSAPGTPALLIPERVALIGTTKRPDGAYGTVFDQCTGNNAPAGKGCVNPYPQRSWPIAGVSCALHSCVVTVTAASGTSCGSTANCAPNSGVAISSVDQNNRMPGWIAGAATHSNNFAGSVTAVSATTVTLQAAVPDAVAASSLNCSSSCGTLYLPTPMIGFVNGDNATVSYVASNSGNSVCYGCYLQSIGLDGQTYEGAVGFEDKFGQERSGADHIGFTDLAWDFIIRGNQAQNGGPFDVFEGNAGDFTSCEGHGHAWIQQAGAVRGLRGATYNAGAAGACNGLAEVSNAMMVVDSRTINIDTNYLSGGRDGILIGSQGAANAVNVTSFSCGATGAVADCTNYGVEISAFNANTSAISVLGGAMIANSGQWVAALKNDATGSSTGNDQQMGAYFYDNNGVGKVSEISTSDLIVAGFPAGITTATPSPGDNSTKVATTAYVQNQAYAPLASPTFTGTPIVPGYAKTSTLISGNYASATGAGMLGDSTITAGPYAIGWMTELTGGNNGYLPSSAANKAMMWGVTLTYPLSTSQVTYDIGSNADNTATNNYDLGLYNSGGTLVLNLNSGTLHGSSLAPATGAFTLSWAQGSKTLQPGDYYLMYYTSNTTATPPTLVSPSATAFTFYKGEAGGTGTCGVTTQGSGGFAIASQSGGALPTSITAPANSYSWGACLPAIWIH